LRINEHADRGGPTVSDRIEREILLIASAEEVWAALTDPAWLEGWLAEEVELELRPGGDARFRDGDVLRTGWVEEVSPPPARDDRAGHGGRLTFWWAADGEPASRVELTIDPAAQEGTVLRVVETRPLELLDLVGIPLPGAGGAGYGPALVAA
jgi:uncharacterized protein YndB with AHSA1/START domain